MLGAGIQLSEAVRVIGSLLNPGEFKDIVLIIYDLLKEGQEFSHILERFPRIFFQCLYKYDQGR